MPTTDGKRSKSWPFDAGNASPATVWRAPRFATEGGQLAAGVVQCAILDLKETEVGWQSELVTTKKCEFSHGNTNDSIVFA